VTRERACQAGKAGSSVHSCAPAKRAGELETIAEETKEEQ
jgi:hypothetical protein